MDEKKAYMVYQEIEKKVKSKGFDCFFWLGYVYCLRFNRNNGHAILSNDEGVIQTFQDLESAIDYLSRYEDF